MQIRKSAEDYLEAILVLSKQGYFKTNQILGTPQACARYDFPAEAVNPEYFIDHGLILSPFGESFLTMIHRLRQGEERVSCIIKNRNHDGIVHWSHVQ